MYTAVGVAAFDLHEVTPDAGAWAGARLAQLVPPLPASAPLSRRVLARRALVLLACWLAWLPEEMLPALLGAAVASLECDDLAVADAGACLAEGVVGGVGVPGEVRGGGGGGSRRSCAVSAGCAAGAGGVCCAMG